MVPHEGVEGPQLRPAHAQLLRGVAQEAADVGPDQGHPQQVEEQDFCRAESDGARPAQGQGQACLLSWPLQRRLVDRLLPNTRPGRSTLAR